MALRAALPVLLFVWCLSSSHYGIEGRRLSKEEDLELEKQLKLLNKPAIKTIRVRKRYYLFDFDFENRITCMLITACQIFS